MDEAGYRTFLARRGLGADSVHSYVSNARCVERLLNLDLHTTELTEAGLSHIESQLRRGRHVSGLSEHRLSSCMTAVRRYADHRFGAAAPPARTPSMTRAAPPEPDSPSANGVLGDAFAAYRRSMDLLRAHGISRSGNGIVGDYAELLFAKAFEWVLAPNCRAAYDAVDARGLHYQIKARRLTASSGSRQLGGFRRLPERGFDTLAAVLFDPAFQVERAVLVPFDVVAARASYIAHTNSWRFMLDDKVCRLPEVRHVTSKLREAAAALGVAAAKPATSGEALDAFAARWQPALDALFGRADPAQNV